MSETLNEKLDRLGYTTEPCRVPNAKHIMKDGELVFTGDCFEVDQFLDHKHCICGAWESCQGYDATWDSSEDWCPIHSAIHQMYQ